MARVVLLAHDIRSTHNVGSLLRTADGLGIEKVYLTGYTPYPLTKPDNRLPHLAAKINSQISKTALGAEKSVNWSFDPDILEVIDQVNTLGYTTVALEQSAGSTKLTDFKPPAKVALVVGNEVGGLEPEILKACSLVLEIPMAGAKESFNVSVAAAIAMYYLREQA